MDTDKVQGIMPRILVTYFLAQYIILIISFQYEITFEPINLLFFSLLFLYVMVKLKDGINKNAMFMYFIYISFLAATLTFTAFFANDPVYSVIRILITSWLLMIMMIIMFYVFKQTWAKISWSKAISKSLIIIMIIAPIGQLLIPEWKYGMRLSGGINPNSMGYIALFCNFWFFFQKISGDKTRSTNLAWLLSFALLIWTMSRSVFLSMGILYGGYIFFLIISGMYRLSLKRIVLIPALITSVLLFFNYITNTLWFKVNAERLLDPTNLESRGSAWDIALEVFNQNVLVGSAGWWGLSGILGNSNALADTPHNSYIRILSESGLIGLVVVMILPAFLLLWLLFSSFSKNIVHKRQMFLIISMLISLFANLFFEDRYLIGFGGFNTGAMVWVMAMGLFFLIEQPQEKDEKIYPKQKNTRRRKRYRLTW